MNRRISTTEVKQNLTAILHDVEEGNTFVILSDGEEVAQLSPVEKADVDVDEERNRAHRRLLERLEQVKAINAGPWTRAEIYEEEE